MSVEPRGLRPGIIFLILFPKRAMCILFYPKSFGRTHDFPSGGRKAYR
jgi:hypothetical protein